MSAALREARDSDLDAIASMDRGCSPVFASVGRYRALLGDNGLLLVAEVSAVIKGFAAWSRVLDEATLLNLAVLPEARRGGLARALLNAGSRRLAAAGVQRMLLEVRAGNTAAQALYGATGFSRDGERAAYYPARDGRERESAVLMSLSLEVPDACAGNR